MGSDADAVTGRYQPHGNGEDKAGRSGSSGLDEAPFCITNPSHKHYKFLFRIALDDDTLPVAMGFINDWLEEKGWSIKRQKVVAMPLHGMFQVRIWLT